MTKQTITALYDSREYANNATLMLQQSGLSDLDVAMSPESAARDIGAKMPDRQNQGFWAYLEGLFGGTEDHDSYSEGLRRGGTLVTVTTIEENIDEVIDILEEHGSVDLNEREAGWRNDGWTRTSSEALRMDTGAAVAVADDAGGIASPTAASYLGSINTAATGATLDASGNSLVDDRATSPRSPAETEGHRGANTDTMAGAMGQHDNISSRMDSDEVVQVVEEQLNVGKRAVNRGRVRLHSYVVETPVTENVTLHEERVTIDRRPVNREASAADLGADAFRERTIEMDETHEEAVIGKTARVVEEIGLRKDAGERVETVSDSVRSIKVDIDDARTTGTSTSNGVLAGNRLNVGDNPDYNSQISENMEVVGSDGGHVGVIDHVQSTVIKLKKNDVSADGRHHLVPVDWIADVNSKVLLKISANDAKMRWQAA